MRCAQQSWVARENSSKLHQHRQYRLLKRSAGAEMQPESPMHSPIAGQHPGNVRCSLVQQHVAENTAATHRRQPSAVARQRRSGAEGRAGVDQAARRVWTALSHSAAIALRKYYFVLPTLRHHAAVTHSSGHSILDLCDSSPRIAAGVCRTGSTCRKQGFPHKATSSRSCHQTCGTQDQMEIQYKPLPATVKRTAESARVPYLAHATLVHADSNVPSVIRYRW